MFPRNVPEYHGVLTFTVELKDTLPSACECAKLLHSRWTLCDAMDCSLPGPSVHGILQARMLEWVAISFSGDLPNPGIQSTSLKSPASSGEFFVTSVNLQKMKFSTQSLGAKV